MGCKINLVNGNIITLDESCPSADTISLENGKIAGINAIDHNYKNIDLQGATVIPGFTDSHFHLTNLGKQLDTLQLKDCRSSHEVVEKVLKKSAKMSHNDWIIGFGWDQINGATPIFPKQTF